MRDCRDWAGRQAMAGLPVSGGGGRGRGRRDGGRPAMAGNAEGRRRSARDVATQW